jgi:hypothetical protein
MRQMADIDFYIPPDSAELFENIAVDAGWCPEERRNRPREWWAENFQHLEPLLSPDRTVKIEAHLRNAGREMPYQMDVARAWERSTVRDYDGREVRVMAPDDDLAALILHLYVHDIYLVKLLGLCDLDRVVRAGTPVLPNPPLDLPPSSGGRIELELRAGTPPPHDGGGRGEVVPAKTLDWDRFVHEGREQGYLHLLHLPLALAADLLGTPVPAEVLAQTRPDDLTDADIAFLREFVFRDDVARQQVPARVTEAMEARGISGKARVLLRSAFPSKNSLAERYNLPADSSRVCLYRLLHPLFLLKRWGGFLANLLAGDARQKRIVRLSAKVRGWARTDAP